VDDEREKLLEYRERVVSEYERRTERTRRLESEAAATEFLLNGEKQARRVLAGNTVDALGRAAYRARLERELKSLKSELNEAREELMRAEQRLREVDLELEAMGPNEDRESKPEGEDKDAPGIVRIDREDVD